MRPHGRRHEAERGLAWAKGRDSRELLELSMALETDSYDLYIRWAAGGRSGGEEGLRRLVEEEKEHLARMAALLDRKL